MRGKATSPRQLTELQKIEPDGTTKSNVEPYVGKVLGRGRGFEVSSKHKWRHHVWTAGHFNLGERAGEPCGAGSFGHRRWKRDRSCLAAGRHESQPCCGLGPDVRRAGCCCAVAAGQSLNQRDRFHLAGFRGGLCPRIHRHALRAGLDNRILRADGGRRSERRHRPGGGFSPVLSVEKAVIRSGPFRPVAKRTLGLTEKNK